MKMNEKDKCFCIKCRSFSEYSVVECLQEGKIKNRTYKYIGKHAKCVKCKSLLFVPKINDENLESLYNVYRKENDIVSIDIVTDLLRKYNIGKRPLSRLLNWGELTYSRFVDGDVPSKRYSEMIVKLYNNRPQLLVDTHVCRTITWIIHLVNYSYGISEKHCY